MPVQHDTIAPHNSHHIAASAEIKESDAEYLAKHNIRAHGGHGPGDRRREARLSWCSS